MPSSDPSPSLPRAREIRTVRADRAFAWYSEALRLFKRQPGGFVLLAIAVTAADLVLSLIPVAGLPAANVVVPILASSLLFAGLATDRGDKPRAMHVLAPFAAPAHALAAVIAAALVVAGAEWLAGWHFAGVNTLSLEDRTTLSVRETMFVYGSGIAVSLPLTLVPLFAFLEGASVRDAFNWSVQAFARNVAAFLLYAGLSMALLGVVFVTHGLAAPIVLPLWTLSSYVAWKDLFGIA